MGVNIAMKALLLIHNLPKCAILATPGIDSKGGAPDPTSSGVCENNRAASFSRRGVAYGEENRIGRPGRRSLIPRRNSEPAAPVNTREGPPSTFARFC